MKLQGQVLTPNGFQHGHLEFDTRITAFAPNTQTGGPYIVPGLIDVHVHGGGGADTMDGADGVRTLARFHAQHGTTALLATTITNPWPNIIAALHGIRDAMHNPNPNGAHIVGAHLEGPFISPQRLGAQPAFAIAPNATLTEEALNTNVIRVATIAPELENIPQTIAALVAANVRISIGHSHANTEQTNATLHHTQRLGGNTSATHLFNAMGGMTGRDPGIVGAILANPTTHAEIILDTHHVHPNSFLAALQAKPRHLMLITDAIRATGQPNGQYDLGGQTVQLHNGRCTLPDGTLAGSVLTMIEAVRNAVNTGVPLEQALRLGSTNPARYLGLSNKGQLQPGNDADVLVLSEDLEIEAVYVGGNQIA